jgi:hypothetical protein
MPQLDIRNGIPAPPLLSWMKLRIASERNRFYGGVWRDVLSEIQVILSKNRLQGNDDRLRLSLEVNLPLPEE